MLDRLRAWLEDEGRAQTGGRDELQLAVAALLIEAARVDGAFGEEERALIARLLERRFGLGSNDAQMLEDAAEQRAERSSQLFGFTRTINQRLPRERKVELIEMLWEVAYADGVLDPLEDTLVRRVGGLIDVSDHDRGAARLRVMERLRVTGAGMKEE
jgi:uncharacterized tellurite resistance protein B-like protein